VLIRQCTKGNWRFSQVEELISSKDGLVRSAKVRTQTGKTLNRPLCLLYPLETMTKVTNRRTDEQTSKLQRKAAKEALECK